MTSGTVPSSTGRHTLTSAITIALQLILTHNGVGLEAASGIALGVAGAIGGALRWLISR